MVLADTSQNEQLIAAGAVESGILMLRRRSYNGQEYLEPWPYLRHFFNAAGDEVGYISDIWPGHIHWFSPPRRWDPTIKDHFHITQVYRPEHDSLHL